MRKTGDTTSKWSAVYLPAGSEHMTRHGFSTYRAARKWVRTTHISRYARTRGWKDARWCEWLIVPSEAAMTCDSLGELFAAAGFTKIQ